MMQKASERTAFEARRADRPPPEIIAPLMAWLTAELPSHLGAPVVRLEPVNYQDRLFSRLFRVAVFTQAEKGPERHLYVKVFKSTGSAEDVERMRRRVAHDFERTREIHRTMASSTDLRVVTPVVCNPDYLATITEEAPGRTLFDHLRSHAGWVPALRCHEPATTMERIGRWVQAFQAGAPSRGVISIDALRSYVDVRLQKLAALPHAGFSSDDRRRVLAYIDRTGAEVEPSDLREVTIHGDLAPGNILVSPDGVTVLDFAMVGLGSRLHDLSRLFVQIELMALKPQIRTAVLQRANRALLGAFDASLTPQQPMFRLLLMLHRVNHLLTLSTARGAFPASVYNWHVRRHHRAWITRELRRLERESP